MSYPNYLGENVIANLAPRALAHHGWHRPSFPDYPRARKALIPLVV